MTSNANRLLKGWSEAKLSDCLEQVSTRNQNRECLPVLSVTNKAGFVLQSETFGRELHSADTYQYRVVSRGEFGYNPARINVGSIARVTQFEKGLLSPMYVVFRTSKRLSPDFLEYYIRSDRFSAQVDKNIAGSVRQTLNYSALEQFDLIIPDSLSEQSRIAEYLSITDRAIEDLNALIAKLNRLKQGLTQDLLTRGIDENGIIRTEKTHKFKDSPFGPIPEGWMVDKLCNAATKISVGLATSVTKYYRDAGIPIIRNQNIRRGYFDDSEILFLDPAFASRFPTKKVTKGDVLICRTGANVGDSCLVPDEYVGSHTFTTLIVSPKHSRLDSPFLVRYLNSELGLRELNNILVGAGKNNLNAGQLVNFRLLLPNVVEQERISCLLILSDTAIEREEALRDKLMLLKRGLMEDLLSGRVRVNHLIKQ